MFYLKELSQHGCDKPLMALSKSVFINILKSRDPVRQPVSRSLLKTTIILSNNILGYFVFFRQRRVVSKKHKRRYAEWSDRQWSCQPDGRAQSAYAIESGEICQQVTLDMFQRDLRH